MDYYASNFLAVDVCENLWEFVSWQSLRGFLKWNCYN